MNQPETVLADDIAAFIEAQPADLPYSRLAALVRDRFGDDRAVDPATLRAWWLSHRAAIGRSAWKYDREVRDTILDLLGRVSGEAILNTLRQRFDAKRVPKRSALYRFIKESAQGVPDDSNRQMVAGGKTDRKRP